MTIINRRQALIGAASLLAAPAIVKAKGAVLPIRFTLDIQVQGIHALYYLARERGISARKVSSSRSTRAKDPQQ